MTTSVVVVAYQPHEWLRRCLESVADQADELIVVDNGSPNEEIRRAAGAHRARVIRLDTNVGFPAGVNAGVAAATGDVIALLNDDAFAASNWIAVSRDVLADPTIGAVGPKLLYARTFAEIVLDDEPHFGPGDARPLGRMVRTITVDNIDALATGRGRGLHALEHDNDGDFRWTAGRDPFYVPAERYETVALDGAPITPRRFVQLINSAGMRLQRDGYAGDIGDGEADDGQHDLPADRFGICGAAIAFRRDTWERIGPFAGEFFAYYEDTDWCWRAQLAGWRMRYEPTTVVHHIGGASTGGAFDERTRFLYQRNRVLTLMRNAPARRAGKTLTEVIFHESHFGVPLLRQAVVHQLVPSLRQRTRAGSSLRSRTWRAWAK